LSVQRFENHIAARHGRQVPFSQLKSQAGTNGIGWDQNGRAMWGIRVYVIDGNVVNAFPVP
jgi:hypothetical protein